MNGAALKGITQTVGTVTCLAGKKAAKILSPMEAAGMFIKRCKMDNELSYRVLTTASTSSREACKAGGKNGGIFQKLKGLFTKPVEIVSFFDKDGKILSKSFSQGDTLLKRVAYDEKGKALWSIKYEPNKVIWQVANPRTGKKDLSFIFSK